MDRGQDLGKILAAGAVGVAAFSAFTYRQGYSLGRRMEEPVHRSQEHYNMDQNADRGAMISTTHNSTHWSQNVPLPPAMELPPEPPAETRTDLRVVFLAGAALILYFTSK